MSKRKYLKGRLVANMDDLDRLIKIGFWFYFGSSTRPKHPSIITNMTFWTLREFINGNRLWLAEKIQEENNYEYTEQNKRKQSNRS